MIERMHRWKIRQSGEKHCAQQDNILHNTFFLCIRVEGRMFFFPVSQSEFIFLCFRRVCHVDFVVCSHVSLSPSPCFPATWTQDSDVGGTVNNAQRETQPSWRQDTRVNRGHEVFVLSPSTFIVRVNHAPDTVALFSPRLPPPSYANEAMLRSAGSLQTTGKDGRFHVSDSGTRYGLELTAAYCHCHIGHRFYFRFLKHLVSCEIYLEKVYLGVCL